MSARLPAFAVIVAIGSAPAACGFNPSGGEAFDDDGAPADAPPNNGDGAELDAAVIDAPPIDAPVDAAIDAPIDAAIDAPPPTCPVNYNVMVGASRFRFVTNVQPFNNAVGDCANDAVGATHLATIEDAGDIDPLHAGRGGSEMFWVHATCSPVSGVACDDQAAWHWQPDGEAVTGSLWGSGEPNNPTSERNAITFKTNGNWRINNVSASEVHAYICECGD